MIIGAVATALRGDPPPDRTYGKVLLVCAAVAMYAVTFAAARKLGSLPQRIGMGVLLLAVSALAYTMRDVLSESLDPIGAALPLDMYRADSACYIDELKLAKEIGMSASESAALVQGEINRRYAGSVAALVLAFLAVRSVAGKQRSA